MLDETPAAEVGLNELSRRVGLAKSNVLRYFESREAVLLELLTEVLEAWIAEVSQELADGVDPRLPARERGDQVAAVISRRRGGLSRSASIKRFGLDVEPEPCRTA